MFGYIRPNRGELKVRELESYEAAYCGLCHAIGRRHGLAARMFLSYDIVFLAMLLDHEKCGAISIQRKRCPARLGCRKKRCACDMEGLEAAADMGTILSYWKLRDEVADSGFWRGLAARFLSRLLRHGYRLAAHSLPEFDRTVQSALRELRQLEEQRTPSLDRPADTFARILQAAIPPETAEEKRRILEQLLYHIGRWIYLLDAWDDLEEDRQSGSYNPISARFPGEEEAHQEYLRTTLRHSQGLVLSAWGLLEESAWSGIVNNILYLGMPLVEELVFTGQWKAVKKRNGRRIHE
ncbi:DUF5685 family protein [Lawsonibacter celer]|jgi:hypothetical protein|uniref:DUF5685 family protein n=1 Tax=Lawsonibacter celer TaxID=2986526 RepID=UPI0016485723|nr:DUF5685 family protein [Lawsonibacter celer]